MKKLLTIGTLLLCINSFAGNEKGNGGFLYSRTSKKLLDESQSSILSDLGLLLKKRNSSVFQSDGCLKPIDMSELKNKVSDLTYDYQGSSPAINPEGDNEKRFFYIDETGKIEATELFFASFVDAYFRYQEEDDLSKKQIITKPIRKAIIHEALHFFDYNELEARKCAPELHEEIETYDSTKARIAEKLIKEQNKNFLHEKLEKHNCLDKSILEEIKIEVARSPVTSEIFLDRTSFSVVKCILKNSQWGFYSAGKNPVHLADVIDGLHATLRKKDCSTDDVEEFLNNTINIPGQKNPSWVLRNL